MQVSQAIEERISCRAFSSKRVSLKLMRTILEKAARAPSGGNLQPWHLFAITGNKLKQLLTEVTQKSKKDLITNFNYIRKNTNLKNINIEKNKFIN